jgi:hypothetical protein
MAQNGLSWKVADAKKADIHPLYALGSPTNSFSPSVIPMQNEMAGLGQDIGRAIDAGLSKKGRVQRQLQELSLERAGLQNDLLRSQIARNNSAQLGPGMPELNPPSFVERSTGVPPTNPHPAPQAVEVVPFKRTDTYPRKPWMTGEGPDVSFLRTPTGYAPVPSEHAKERIEDNFIPQTMWSFRNNLLPNFSGNVPKPPKSALPKGAHSWKWSYSRQEWQADYDWRGRTVPLPKERR